MCQIDDIYIVFIVSASLLTQYHFFFLLVRRPPISTPLYSSAASVCIRDRAEGGAQPNISKEKIVNSILPLPPLEEQHRIVAKLEEILPLCERLK